MRARLRWLRRQLEDGWILFFAPALAARLPWALLRFLARFRVMYPEPAAAAAAAAPACFPEIDRVALDHDVRSIWLQDAADLAWSRRHPVEALPPGMRVRGAWPTGPFVVVAYHYGASLAICRSLRRQGHRSRFISARLESAAFRAWPLRYRYGRRRLAEVERLGGAPIAWRPGVRESLLASIDEGICPLGLIDVPPRVAPRGQRPVRLLDRPASLPDGLLLLARDAGVPLVPCWVELDPASGRRCLRIGEALSPTPLEPVLAELANLLDRLIRRQPAAWMFWNEWPDWVRDAAALHAPAFSNVAAKGRL